MRENAKKRPVTGRSCSRPLSGTGSVDSNDPEKGLKYRQSLAARIKSEVVGKLSLSDHALSFLIFTRMSRRFMN